MTEKLRKPYFGKMARALVVALATVAAPSAHAQTFKVLYTFTGSPDGTFPAGNPLLHGGKLYGTTNVGGLGFGTIFQVDIQTDQETVHTFAGSPSDGANPVAALIPDSAGNLYGTTCDGGTNNQGTVFQMNSAGAVTLLHSFNYGQDGYCPEAALIRDSAGNLYGTTTSGGPPYFGLAGFGTVFKLDTTNHLTILHTFRSQPGGAAPTGLILRKATLYGTTESGGADNCGAVFSTNVNTGKAATLYSFTCGSDGGNPLYGPLIADAEGNLYGTTHGGGVGYGVVFELNIATRKEAVLYTFTDGTDGANPYAGLIRDSQGNLYGTAHYGGASGYGTVFKVDTAGTLTTLYAFTGGADGGYPQAGLVRDSKGNLYGMASVGGSAVGYSGNGTVFEITP